MSEATLTSKGQITIPSDIRKQLGLESGARVVFTPLDDGTVVIRAKTRPAATLRGLLEPPRGRFVAVDDMDIGRALMPGLDTNVLVRWLVDDDARQCAQVAVLLASAARERQTLFVPVTVVLELEWVLRARYGFGKGDILRAFNALLECRELTLQCEPAVERALHAYRLGTADFADALHAGLCGADGHAPLLTFDTRAARLAGAALLGD